MSFRNHSTLCKGKELKHAELTFRQSGGEEGRSVLSAPVQRPYILDCSSLLHCVFIPNCFNLSLDYSYPLYYLFSLQYYKLTYHIYVNGELHIVSLAGTVLSNFSSINE